MGRKKNDREDDIVERLEKEIRELKSINRSLLKRLKKVDKEYHKSLDAAEETKEEDLQEIAKPIKLKNCNDCGKGTIKEINLMGRIFLECSGCGPKGKKDRIR